jgi:hypothetical protein
VLQQPDLPSLASVTIPEFDFPTLPTFTATAPEFQGSAVSTVLQWSEEPYEPELLDETAERLRAMWTGGLGLPPAVEQALWERAANREDVAIQRDIAAAMLDFSSRGFSLPPGALVDRVDTIRSDGQVRKLALGREVLLKIADTQVENLRFAVTQSLAAENVLVGIWTATAQRQFEAAKIQLDSQLSLFNAMVALYNARQQGYATEATVFRTRLEGELARLQVFRARIEGAVAQGQLNEQAVRVYGERVKALMANIEVYRARVEGVRAVTEQQRAKVDIYRSQIEARAEEISADKTRFEAYESRMRGETAKAQLVDSQARAYASYVSGQATKADIGMRNQAAAIARNEQLVRAYIANVEKDKALVGAQSAGIQASAEAYRANTARYIAEAGAESTRIELAIKGKDAEMRSSIALYEVEMRKWMADMEQMIRVAGVQLEAMKAAAQASSTMAAGAMAGISLSAGVSGTGSVSASGSRTDVSSLSL